MRAGERDAIGRLADTGNDCVEAGPTQPGRRRGRAQVVASDVSLVSQVGRSAGGTWLASRASTAAVVSATAKAFSVRVFAPPASCRGHPHPAR